MLISVRLFGLQRQQTGWRQCRLELADGTTVSGAWRELVERHPVLGPATSSVRFARNAEYAADDDQLRDGDELAIIPPVAGGADSEAPPEAPRDGQLRPDALVRIELAPLPIDDAALLAELRESLPTAADGALVFFVGQTRETPGTPAPGQEEAAARHAGERVLELDYEAFEEMAVRVLDRIAREIGERFGVRRLAIIHRTGRVGVGETSVVIVAAAAHRAAAFDACRYAIEELKARAPIWKSERFADGTVWIGAPARPGPPRA